MNWNLVISHMEDTLWRFHTSFDLLTIMAAIGNYFIWLVQYASDTGSAHYASSLILYCEILYVCVFLMG
jgi:hypothetical protein